MEVLLMFILGFVGGFIADHFVFKSGYAVVVDDIEAEFSKLEGVATKQTRALIAKIRNIL
jgi:hypothetical protein